MKKAEREAYIERIRAKFYKCSTLGERVIFAVAMRTHSATVPGNQGRKPNRKVMDEAFKEAFPSILSVIK